MTIAVCHMDNRHTLPLPNDCSNVSKHIIFRSSAEVKRELKKLVHLVTEEEEDKCRGEVYDDICETARSLKERRCRKPEAAGPSKSFSKELDSVSVPDCFLCPISFELMRDPVILATGQTYDRPYIQAWLDAGHRTCPRTEQVLPHMTLTPNYLVRTMIEQWCEWQGLQQPQRSASGDNGVGMTAGERKYATTLVAKLSMEGHQSQQREAARELRALSRRKAAYRTYLAQEAQVIPALIPLHFSPDSEIQEHAVTTLLNLSINNDANKRRIVEEGALHPIVEVLRNGSMPARENAAATLFSVSAIEENKVSIGASRAIPALVELLREGSWRGKKDAASALFNLCICQGNRGKCVRAGIVPILLKVIKNQNHGEEEEMAGEALAILAFISGNEEGSKAIGDAGALPLLMRHIKHSSPRNKENAVVILFALCSRDSTYLREVKSIDGGDGYMALLDLSMSGTSRGRRKANALLERMNKQ